MHYECLRCERETFRGVLPGASCGLLSLLYLFLSVTAVAVGIRLFGAAVASFPPLEAFVWLAKAALGGWWRPLVMLCGGILVIAAALLGMIALSFGATLAEWACISVVPCKSCGSHRFSLGRTHGFGL